MELSKIPNLKVLYFDGVCGLCNRFVDFLLARPGLPEGLMFCSLQSEFAPKLTQIQGDTVVLSETGASLELKYSYQSDAVLRVITSLGGAWTLFKVFYLIPRGVRDQAYRFVARTRYRWFGKLETCRIPSNSEKSRFLS